MQEHVFNYFPLLAELDMYLQCRRFASPHGMSPKDVFNTSNVNL